MTFVELIPPETPYKIIKYLVKLTDGKSHLKKYIDNKVLVHLIERQWIVEQSPNKLKARMAFHDRAAGDLKKLYHKYDSFIKKYKIEFIENYYSIEELDALLVIDEDRTKIVGNNLSLQEILATYFKGSKHAKVKSNLTNAIRTILEIEEFPEDEKDQQYLSILYPKKETRFIILCENKNRLRMPRHDCIEFWYVGGKNVNQLKYVPSPKYPIYYLFDWDFQGLNIYVSIKKKYFGNLKAFIPSNYQSLMVKQEEVKHHRSRWENKSILNQLTDQEKLIVSALLYSDSIIEEQKILLSEENLLANLIGCN